MNIAIFTGTRELFTGPIVDSARDTIGGFSGKSSIPAAGQHRFDIAHAHDRITRQHGEPLDDIAEFADVARPVVAFEQLHCGGRKLAIGQA